MSSLSKTCDRCGVSLTNGTMHTMSKFNTDTVCMPCKEDERLAPGYEHADKIEYEAVRAGVRNFPGVGLSAEDIAFLAERRAQRQRENETTDARVQAGTS